MNIQLQQKFDDAKKNPRIKKALDVFEDAQKIYERAVSLMTIKQKPKYMGSYSSSLSEKNYYADIPTTIR